MSLLFPIVNPKAFHETATSFLNRGLKSLIQMDAHQPCSSTVCFILLKGLSVMFAQEASLTYHAQRIKS